MAKRVNAATTEVMEKWRAYLVAERQSARATKANRKELELATHKAWIAWYKARFPTQEWR